VTLGLGRAQAEEFGDDSPAAEAGLYPGDDIVGVEQLTHHGVDVVVVM